MAIAALDICANNHGGNPESVAANLHITDTKAVVRDRIYDFAFTKGTVGITADELAAEWGVSHNHVAPRLSELKRDHRLTATTQRRATRSGCTATVLVASVFA